MYGTHVAVAPLGGGLEEPAAAQNVEERRRRGGIVVAVTAAEVGAEPEDAALAPGAELVEGQLAPVVVGV